MELKHLFLAGLGVMTLAACSSLDDDSTWDVNGGAVKFTSYISKHKASGTTWASGDQIGIYMKANGTALADAAVQRHTSGLTIRKVVVVPGKLVNVVAN